MERRKGIFLSSEIALVAATMSSFVASFKLKSGPFSFFKSSSAADTISFLFLNINLIEAALKPTTSGISLTPCSTKEASGRPNLVSSRASLSVTTGFPAK